MIDRKRRRGQPDLAALRRGRHGAAPAESTFRVA